MSRSKLHLYGDPIFRWIGEGHLRLADGTRLPIRFNARQVTSGAIIVETKGNHIPPLIQGVRKLTGQTKDGRRVEFTLATPSDSSFSSRKTSRGWRNVSTDYWFASGCRTFSRSRARPRDVAFGITNLEIGPLGPDVLTTKVAQAVIEFRRRPDYDEAIAQARLRRSIILTAQARFALGRRSVRNAVELVSDVCRLMSFARGTMVNWIYYEVLDAAGGVLETVHEEKITRAFAALAPIPPEDVAAFIESTFPTLRADRLFRFRRAIHSVIDAKSGSFLETRAIAAGVAVEYLVTRWGTTQTNSWQKQRFTPRLLSMNKSLRLGIPVARLRWFVKARNSLIHEAEFLRGQADWRQYLRLIQILDTMYARLLGYQGAVSDYARWNT